MSKSILGTLRNRPIAPKLYVGAMNDCLFIIDQPPRPSADYLTACNETNVVAKLDYAGAENYARLFAAAPELLTACEEAYHRLQCIHAEGTDEIHADAAYKMLGEAIAKAKGQ